MEQIAGPFVDENDDIVDLAPKPETVAAQLLFENGYYSGMGRRVRKESLAPPCDSDRQRLYRGHGGGPCLHRILEVKSVDMITKPLYGDGPIEHRHADAHNSVIEILVSNRCVDKNSRKPEKARRLTTSNAESTRMAFEIVQIDKDFAFNYRMLHPATLASLKKFLPVDPVTGEPRYPVPEKYPSEHQQHPSDLYR